MNFKTLTRLTAVSALAMGFAGAASAQSIEDGPSVLERILGAITTTTTDINEGEISSVYANIAATSLSLLDRADADVPAVLEDVLGNIDASIIVDFSATGNQPLLSESLIGDDVLGAPPDATNVSRTFQAMEGTLGDLSTTAIGAVLDDSASITTGAVQDVQDTVAGAAMAVSQSTEMESAVLMNAALNSATLSANVTLDVADYALAAADIATTAIGAVGGGSITAGNIEQLNRTVSSFVGSTN